MNTNVIALQTKLCLKKDQSGILSQTTYAMLAVKDFKEAMDRLEYSLRGLVFTKLTTKSS